MSTRLVACRRHAASVNGGTPSSSSSLKAVAALDTATICMHAGQLWRGEWFVHGSQAGLASALERVRSACGVRWMQRARLWCKMDGHPWSYMRTRSICVQSAVICIMRMCHTQQHATDVCVAFVALTDRKRRSKGVHTAAANRKNAEIGMGLRVRSKWSVSPLRWVADAGMTPVMCTLRPVTPSAAASACFYAALPACCHLQCLPVLLIAMARWCKSSMLAPFWHTAVRVDGVRRHEAFPRWC